MICLLTDRLHILVGSDNGRWVWLRTSTTLLTALATCSAFSNRIVVLQNDAFQSYTDLAGWKYGFTDIFSLQVDGVIYNAVPTDYDLGDFLPWLATNPTWAGQGPLTIVDSMNTEKALESTLGQNSFLTEVTYIGSERLLGFHSNQSWEGELYTVTPVDIYTGTDIELACKAVSIDGYVYPAAYFNLY